MNFYCYQILWMEEVVKFVLAIFYLTPFVLLTVFILSWVLSIFISIIGDLFW